MDTLENAKRQTGVMLDRFALTIDPKYREDFFHPMNRDAWVPAFCEWFAADQAKMAAVRASND